MSKLTCDSGSKAVDADDAWGQEWPYSDWRPGAGEEQLGTVDWMGDSWGQQGDEEDFA